MATVEKTEYGTWRVRWRDPNGGTQSRTFKKKAGADDWSVKVEHDKRVGAYIDQTAGRVTFRAFAEEWRGAQVHRTGTARRTESYLRVHIYPKIGERPIGAVRWGDPS